MATDKVKIQSANVALMATRPELFSDDTLIELEEEEGDDGGDENEDGSSCPACDVVPGAVPDGALSVVEGPVPDG